MDSAIHLSYNRPLVDSAIHLSYTGPQEFMKLTSINHLFRSSHIHFSFLNKTTAFLFRTSDSWCLKEKQSETTIPLPTSLPGVTFSADDQCKHQYGNLARQCKRYKVSEISMQKHEAKLWTIAL